MRAPARPGPWPERPDRLRQRPRPSWAPALQSWALQPLALPPRASHPWALQPRALHPWFRPRLGSAASGFPAAGFPAAGLPAAGWPAAAPVVRSVAGGAETALSGTGQRWGGVPDRDDPPWPLVPGIRLRGRGLRSLLSDLVVHRLRGCFVSRPGRSGGRRGFWLASLLARAVHVLDRPHRSRPRRWWPAPGGPVTLRRQPRAAAKPHPGFQVAASLPPGPISRRCSPRRARPAGRLPLAGRPVHAEPGSRWRASSARPCRACPRFRVPPRPAPTGRHPAPGRRTRPGESPPRRGERANVRRPPRAGSAALHVRRYPGPGPRSGPPQSWAPAVLAAAVWAPVT